MFFFNDLFRISFKSFFNALLQRTVRFCEQLATVIPNAHVFYRRGLALKRVIPQCIARDFTYLMVINEDRKVPSILTDSWIVGEEDDDDDGGVFFFFSFQSVLTQSYWNMWPCDCPVELSRVYMPPDSSAPVLHPSRKDGCVVLSVS